MAPTQIESTRNSIDIHRDHIHRKRIKQCGKGVFDEYGNHGHIVSRVLKAFGTPFCKYGVVLKTLDTLTDIVDTQYHLVDQLVKNDICLLLVSWLGQSKRNSSSEIPIKLLKCISRFLSFSAEHNKEIARLFVDGFLYENLAIIFSIFKSDGHVVLYVGRILRSLAEADHSYDEHPYASHFLECIATTLLHRNVGITILFDFCYGVKDWSTNILNKKMKPIVEQVVNKIFSGGNSIRPKTVRQFLTSVLLSSFKESRTDSPTSPIKFSFLGMTDERKENGYLIDATLQCFLDNSSNDRLTHLATTTLCVLLHRYYDLIGNSSVILLYSLHHPVCETMIKVLTDPAVSLQVITAILQLFVLLFPRDCLFRQQLLKADFIKFLPGKIASSGGCGCARLLPCGLSIVYECDVESSQLVRSWLPLLQAAQVRCQQFRQKNFRHFLQKSPHVPSLRRGNFPSISLIFSNVHIPCVMQKKSKNPLREVFFSEELTNNIAAFL